MLKILIKTLPVHSILYNESIYHWQTVLSLPSSIYCQEKRLDKEIAKQFDAIVAERTFSQMSSGCLHLTLFHLTFRRSVGLLDIEGWPIVVCSQGSCPLMAGVCIYKEVGRGLSLFVILTVAHNRMRRIFYSLERSLPIVISFSGGLEFSGEA